MKYTPVVIDIANHLMQVHFIDEHTGEIIDKQIKRDALLECFSNRKPCLALSVWRPVVALSSGRVSW